MAGQQETARYIEPNAKTQTTNVHNLFVGCTEHWHYISISNSIKRVEWSKWKSLIGVVTKMKILPAISIVVTTISAIASTAVVISGEEVIINSNGVNNNDAAPTNNIPGRNMPKPSISELHATKSQRMAQRRTRVKAAIANLPNEPNSNLHRMSDEELDKAYLAAEESAKKRGLKQDTTGGRNKNNPGGTFIRRAKQDLIDDRATLRLMEDGRMERKLWGNGGNGNPYAPAGNLVTETNYYGTFIYMYVVFLFVLFCLVCALRGLL